VVYVDRPLIQKFSQAERRACKHGQKDFHENPVNGLDLILGHKWKDREQEVSST